MPRISGFRGTWQPNKRPYLTLTPDVYIALQRETSIVACGDCRRQVSFNSYVTGVSTSANVDSPPGDATVNLSIPDNDVNSFYVDDQFIIIPMMEIEIYAKGYYLVGGFPQYYRIFWGIVSTVTKDWSGGSTTVTISCKDILRWWELSNATINPAFLEGDSSSGGSYAFWQNQFAGMNPYTVIIQLARESMGDFSRTTGSLNDSTLPEKGPERQVIGSYAKDIMAYWQLKFGNIWNNLVLYGMSGQSYQFTSMGRTQSPFELSKPIFEKEQQLKTENHASQLLTYLPSEIAIFKQDLDKAGSVELFQNEIQTKLSVALQARDQIAYEFFMDPSGQIVFKPPFYNLNVIPNKPVSWINDFEIIDDSLTDTEQEVYTHITSSGNAFGGVLDPGLSDEITTPRTGAYDFHLLRRYGFRRLDYATEWAGDSKRLFFHILDYLDRTNAKRQNGTITIPLRPELKLGYPVWVPYYDSFFYVQGISHQFAVGGQATTTLTFIARRQKFIAPNNIGQIVKSGNSKPTTGINNNTGLGANKPVTVTVPTYTISFPDNAGASSGLADTSGNNVIAGQPVSIRNPITGKLTGFPNVVMVFRSQLNADNLQKVMQAMGNKTYKNAASQNQQPNTNGATGPAFQWHENQLNILMQQSDAQKAVLIQRLRAHRYEAAMTNYGAYDYAHDMNGDFQSIGIAAADSITFGTGTNSPNGPTPIQILSGVTTANQQQMVNANATALKQSIADATTAVKTAVALVNKTNADLVALQKNQAANAASNSATSTGNTSNIVSSTPLPGTISGAVAAAQDDVVAATKQLKDAQALLKSLQSQTATNSNTLTVLPSLDIIIRPVSDEFGFEVIGHNRYGRGAFIDRGLVKVSTGANTTTPGQPANQLNIQFAATAGIISDATQAQPGEGQVVNFAAQFEQMQPEDFMTGASFTGSTGPVSNSSQLQFTSATTYQTNMTQNSGTGVWAEADSLRSATTLEELGPSADIPGLANSTSNCACGLDRAEWLSILPQSLISQVLNTGSQMATAQIPTAVLTNSNTTLTSSGDGIVTSTSNTVATSTTAAILGTSNPSDFFSALSNYLSQQFTTQYKSGNASRELQDTAQSQGIPAQNYDSNLEGNLLGDPSDSPFLGPASLGDQSALQSLQSEVNFNFGLTSKQAATASAAFENGSSEINQSLRSAAPGSLSLVSVTTEPPSNTPIIVTQSNQNITINNPAPQIQPVTVQPVPNVKSLVLNPSQNSILAAQQNAATLSPGELHSILSGVSTA